MQACSFIFNRISLAYLYSNPLTCTGYMNHKTELEWFWAHNEEAIDSNPRLVGGYGLKWLSDSYTPALQFTRLIDICCPPCVMRPHHLWRYVGLISQMASYGSFNQVKIYTFAFYGRIASHCSGLIRLVWLYGDTQWLPLIAVAS